MTFQTGQTNWDGESIIVILVVVVVVVVVVDVVIVILVSHNTHSLYKLKEKYSFFLFSVLLFNFK